MAEATQPAEGTAEPLAAAAAVDVAAAASPTEEEVEIARLAEVETLKALVQAGYGALAEEAEAVRRLQRQRGERAEARRQEEKKLLDQRRVLQQRRAQIGQRYLDVAGKLHERGGLDGNDDLLSVLKPHIVGQEEAFDWSTKPQKPKARGEAATLELPWESANADAGARAAEPQQPWAAGAAAWAGSGAWAAEETPTTEAAPAADAPPTAEAAPAVEATAATEAPLAAEEAPATEAVPAAEAAPTAEVAPAVEATAAAEAPLAAEAASPAQVEPAVEEEPAMEATPAEEAVPVAEVALVVEATATTEAPHGAETEPTAEAAPPAQVTVSRSDEFSVSLDKTSGMNLGVKFEDGSTTVIGSIAADGLFQHWNDNNSASSIKPHDRIVAVNGITLPDAMIEEMRQNKVLELTLRREDGVEALPTKALDTSGLEPDIEEIDC